MESLENTINQSILSEVEVKLISSRFAHMVQ
jgi:hypothetical protein